MLNTMSEEQSEMEVRLDDLLSRIAMETEEIKELEQQLTDGQILANNALQRDLEGVISGLRKYLGQLRQQVDCLQTEKRDLQLRLEDTQRRCRQLEDTAQTHTQTLQDQLDFSRSQYDQTWTELVQTRIQLEHFKTHPLEDQVSEELSFIRSEDEPCTSVDRQEASRQKLLRLHNHRQEFQTEKNLDCRVQKKLEKIRNNLQTPEKKNKKVQQSPAPGLSSKWRQDAALEMNPHRSPVRRGSWTQKSSGQRRVTSIRRSGWRNSERGSNSICSSTEGTLLPPAEALPPPLSDVDTPGPSQLHSDIPAGEISSSDSRSGETEGKCVCEHRKTKRLEEKKKKLKRETKELRHTLRQLRCGMQVCEEVQCLEGTLLRRRAELREADRLLLEAQGCVHTTRHQADVLLRRAQSSSVSLREEAEQLRRRKQDEERELREAEEKLRSKTEKLDRLSIKIYEASDRLTNTLSDCQEAQRHLNSLTCQEEQLLLRRREEQEVLRRNEELRNEQQHLQNTISELKEQVEVLTKRATASNAAEEQKLVTLKAELKLHRTALKQVLEELLVEQEGLKVVKTNHKKVLQQLQRNKDELDRKQKDVVKMKDEVERKRKELHDLQQQIKSHKEEAELSFKDSKRHRAEIEEMQEELMRKRDERRSLNEQCKHLEDKRRHAHRCLTALQAEQQRHSQLLKEGGARDTSSNQQQPSDASKPLSPLSDRMVNEEKHQQPGDGDASAEDRTRHLKQHQLHPNLLNEELWDAFKQLLLKDDGLKDESEKLRQYQEELREKEEGLTQMKDRLMVEEEELKQARKELKEEEDWIKKQKKRLKMREEELNKKEEGLHEKEEGLNRIREGLMELKVEQNVRSDFQQTEIKQKQKGNNEQEDGLQPRGAWLNTEKEEFLEKRFVNKLQWKDEHLAKFQEKVFNDFLELSEEEEVENEPFYLCTTGLRSVFSTEEQRWNTELQREELRQEEDRLKVLLRCHLWNQQDNLKASQLETEGNLLDLKYKLDQLDSLLTHTPPET